MGAPTYSAADFLAAFQNLLPTGPVWPRDAAAPATQFYGALMQTYARICARDAGLLVDAFPAAPVELLPEWEASLGLPDPCLGTNPNIGARQAAVLARFVSTGGQSVPYFLALAATLGAAITITQYAPHRIGVDSCWDALRSPDWAYVWLVTLLGQVVFDFEWGSSACWEPFWTLAGGPVVCTINRLAPAHTQVDFSDF